LKRSEIWTSSGGKDYAGKPRPALIVQDNSFDTDSVTVCGLTSALLNAADLRLMIEPMLENGLQLPSQVMIDKVTTVPRSKLGKRIGRLTDAEMLRINRALLVFLGFAGRVGEQSQNNWAEFEYRPSNPDRA
jgi:mRNA interferase MazF